MIGRRREGAEAVAGDKHFAQLVHVAGSFGLAGDGQKILRQRHDNLLRVVDNPRADTEVGDRRGRDHGSDHDVVAFELELRRDHDEERDAAVIDDGAKAPTVDVAETEGNGLDSVGHNRAQHGNAEGRANGNGGDRQQSAAVVDGVENQNKTREVAANVGPVVNVEALEAVEVSAHYAKRKAGAHRGTDNQEQPARLGMQLRRNFENVIDVERQHPGQNQAQRAQAAIGKERGVDDLGEIFNVVGRREF